jgi:putative colanic acid biosynthesis acetyltransferase WcaF
MTPDPNQLEARAGLGRETVNLGSFANPEFDRGAPAWKELAWLTTRGVLFEHGHVGVNALRYRALLAYGAKVGSGLVMRRNCRVTFPWKLDLGDNVWLGEDAWLLNLAPIQVGSNVCISQRAFLCTGNHDWSDPRFRLVTAPIRVEDGAWVGAAAFVGPGVTIGSHAVVAAGSVVTTDMPPYMICGGNPCRPLRERRIGER